MSGTGAWRAGVEGIEVVNGSDRVFLMHLGGKLEVKSKLPIKTRDDLSMAYTPGVGRVSMAMAKPRETLTSIAVAHCPHSPDNSTNLP